MLKLNHLSYHVGAAQILKDVTLELQAGLFHVIAGPNGSGKSTLLKIMSGEYKASAGTVTYNNEPLGSVSKLKLAQQRAVMSQHTELQFPLSVEEVVLMGRYPYFQFRPSANDLQVCHYVMKEMEIESYAQRNYLTLSGGEQQRVQFARVLAQLGNETDKSGKILFLDEAVSSLDIKYQHQLLQKVKSLVLGGVTVVCILHDLNLAVQYADRLFFLKNGSLYASVSGHDELTTTVLQAVYDVPFQKTFTQNGERPLFYR